MCTGTLLKLSSEIGQEYYLRTEASGLYRLSFPAGCVVTLGSQTQVRLDYTSIDATTRVVSATGPPTEVSGPQGRKLAGTGDSVLGPRAIVVYLVDFCNGAAPAAAAQQDVANVLSSTSNNLNDYWSSCSHGYTSLDPNVAYVSVSLCSGVRTDGSGGMWDTSTCNNNLIEWMVAADKVARATLGSLGRFHHKVMILPNNLAQIATSEWYGGLWWGGGLHTHS